MDTQSAQRKAEALAQDVYYEIQTSDGSWVLRTPRETDMMVEELTNQGTSFELFRVEVQRLRTPISLPCPKT